MPAPADPLWKEWLENALEEKRQEAWGAYRLALDAFNEITN
jgi:hypothetical protein